MITRPRQTTDSSSKSLPFEFSKMAGGGNDFVVIDNRARVIVDGESLARRICTRRLSVGADGLILVESSAKATIRMIYFNSDGSRADFCANGTRCAARFAFLNVMAPRRMTIETDSGVVSAEISESSVTLTLPAPRNFQPDKPLETGGGTAEGSFIVVGVPHYVTYVHGDLWSRDIETIGRALRQHRELAPEGANVNFVSITSRDEIRVRTYERGVEAETLSCGSGVVASSCVSALLGKVDRTISVLTRSGIRYLVEMEIEEAGGVRSVRQVKLSGDARLVYKSELTAETVEGFDADWVRNPTSDGPRP
ncbi:MAG: diaminopimelate epimerase [Thermoanaerobaculia bacterium]